MFNFSSKTKVNRLLKLNDLNKEINASKEVKVDEKNIESVILANVISPTTLNVEKDNEIKEIYIFEIYLKERYVPYIFIKELDKKIKFPTLFILKHEDYSLGFISYKKDKYLQTDWFNKISYEIPLNLSISGVYKFILSKFYKYPYFENETILEYVKRNNELNKLDYQIEKTTQAIRYEVQSKKRFEYNKRLKEYNKEKEDLLKEEH